MHKIKISDQSSAPPKSASMDSTAEGKAAIPPSDYDTDLFVSKDAADAYEKRINKKAILERGLHALEKKDRTIMDQIRLRNWSPLCNQPCRGNLSIVREFYANANTDCATSTVRGVKVSYAKEAINDYYRLPTTPDFSWQTVCDGVSRVDLERRLCPKGANWHSSASGSGGEKYGCLHLSDMSSSLEIKAWVRLICSRIMPTRAMAMVNYGRCVLLYAIVEGIPLDVGCIIEGQIRHCAQDTETSFYFPSLITQLCLRAGVPEEAVINDHRTIRRDEQQIPAAAQPPVAPPRRECGSSECSSTVVLRRIDELDEKVSWFGRMMEKMADHIGLNVEDCREPVARAEDGGGTEDEEEEEEEEDEDEEEDMES